SSVMTAYVMRPSSPDAAATAQETDSRNGALDVRPTVSERRPSPSAPRRVASSPALNLARVSAQEPSPASSTSPVTAPASPVTAAPATVNENVPLPPPVLATPVPTSPATVPTAPSTTPTVDATRETRTAGAPANCDSGGDRAMRIAKPGALGGLLGAALGAA